MRRRTKVLVGAIFWLASAGLASAQPWVARHGMTSQQYQSKFNELVKKGYRLVDVAGYGVQGTARYAALWEKKAGPAWVARHGMTSGQYQSYFNIYVRWGYRLVHVSGYTIRGQDRYAAIWEKKGGPAWVARHRMTSAQYQQYFNLYRGLGYRLVQVSGYSLNNQARYAAIWEKKGGPAWIARHGLTSAGYQNAFNAYVRRGYRLKHVSAYTVANVDRYAAIFERTGGPIWAARHRMTSAGYQGEFNNFYYQGYRLKNISGYALGGKARYAAIWEAPGGLSWTSRQLIDTRIQNYMQAQGVPGLTVAITHKGRLVFAKGYGNADNVTKMDPTHRLRVASVSKPITAIAIMKLVQEGQLSLDNTVFGPGSILGNTYGTPPYSTRVRTITVEDLLHHISGWTNAGGDPMFMNYNLNRWQNVSWVLDNRPVASWPGTSYTYLNFGYSVLGRVIEQVTGQSYENYVRTQILNPIGATSMELGGSTLVQRKTKEVQYYGGGAYNMRVPRMDAHGGWIATSIDLVKLMTRVDAYPSKPDILAPSTISTMWTGSAPNSGYAMGWIRSGNYRGHNGAMPGTIGFLVRRNDEFNFAILANTRPAGDNFAFGIKSILDTIVQDVNDWPSYDLF